MAMIDSAYEAIKSTQEFVDKFFNGLNDMLNESIATQYQNVATALLPIAGTLIVMWISFTAIKTILAPGSVNMNDFILRAFKIIVLATIAFSWSYVYRYIIVMFTVALPELIAQMSGSSGDTVVFTFVNNLMTYVKSSIETMQGESMVAGAIGAILITLGVFAVAAVNIVLYVEILLYSKVFIAVLLIMTPIFLTFYWFDMTKNWFFNWVNMVVQPLLTILIFNLMVGLLGGLMLKIFNEFMVDGQPAQTLSGAFLCIVVGVLLWLMLKKTPQMASNLVSSGFGLGSGGLSNPFTSKASKQQMAREQLEQQRHTETNNNLQELTKALQSFSKGNDKNG